MYNVCTISICTMSVSGSQHIIKHLANVSSTYKKIATYTWTNWSTFTWTMWSIYVDYVVKLYVDQTVHIIIYKIVFKMDTRCIMVLVYGPIFGPRITPICDF